MAIITAPSALPIRRIDWTLREPAQVNRSGWTGRRQVVGLPGGGLLMARGSFRQIRGEANFRPWRAFFAKLRGPLNSFYLPATEGPQHALSITPRVNGAGQTGRTLATDGWPNSTTVLPEGALVSIAGTNQIVLLTSAVTSNGSGQATLNFTPALRASPADNALIESKNPVALVSLTGAEWSWSVDVGQMYMIDFEVEEAF